AGEVPAQTEESRALSAQLKRRGFVFVGPVTALALMSAIGIVNTDILGTWKRPSI
ncbi:MAG: DNA-3-methyladenine glycosylase I, partial [Actinomyces sp.]|nr:DNA-3-methyladenine glycosylase I [Actinomyces sp.]